MQATMALENQDDGFIAKLVLPSGKTKCCFALIGAFLHCSILGSMDDLSPPRL